VVVVGSDILLLIFYLSFQYKGLFFQMVDVGGQRAERRKWLHHFDDVDAVIYLAALDDCMPYVFFCFCSPLSCPTSAVLLAVC